MKIGFVTDSTAYIPDELLEQFNIQVVPVKVIISGAAHSEGIDVSVSDVIAAFGDGKAVTTSRPSSNDFIETYQGLLDRGFDEIISVHLSAELSGTYESALLAVAKSELPVRVINSHNIASAVGFAVVGGARLAAIGASIDDVEDYIRNRCELTRTLFFVDTLDYLQRGGRISSVQLRLGTALSLKPILAVADGKIVQQELVRNSERAFLKMVEIAVTVKDVDCDIAVLHVATQAKAEKLASQISKKLDGKQVHVYPAGAVVATHLGPGAIALVLSRQI